MYPPAHAHSTHADKLAELQRITAQPKIALIGTIPSAEALAEEEAAWVSYMTWCEAFCMSEDYTTNEALRAMYNHPWAICAH